MMITIVALHFVAANAWALPSVFFYRQGTDRVGPHSIPIPPVGDSVQIFAVVESNEPIESPTISVEARQGGTSLTLDPLPAALFPIFQIEGFHVFSKFIDFDPGLTGAWEIVPTDSTGTGPSTFTNALIEPEFVPLVENITVQGTSLGATVSWKLPNLAGFDVDGIHFRVIEATSGRHVWNLTTSLLPLQTTSFTAPPGVMQVGVDYVYWVGLVDIEGTDVEENVSLAFSQPFRFTGLSGDFNLDGSVDAADYVVWRNGLGTAYTQDDYGAWRANFGKTAGNGAARYPLGASAESLSAAVPEHCSLVLAGIGIIVLTPLYRYRRIAGHMRDRRGHVTDESAGLSTAKPSLLANGHTTSSAQTNVVGMPRD
jgi:hypothetical protein